MELHRIPSPEDAFFPAMFALYEASFPLSERRARPEQERLLAQPGYFCTAILVDGQFAGLFCWWELDGTCYAEHLATTLRLRLPSGAIPAGDAAHPAPAAELAGAAGGPRRVGGQAASAAAALCLSPARRRMTGFHSLKGTCCHETKTGLYASGASDDGLS